MNTLIRCLRAAELLRRPPADNTHEANFQHIPFRVDVQAGAIAVWVLQSEIRDPLDVDLQATSSCPGVFNYYDLDSSSNSTDPTTQHAESLPEISEKRTSPRRHRHRQKCSCAQREETVDGYEAETEWWCRHDLQHNRECQRYIYSLDHVSAEQEINDIFFGKGSLCKMLRWRIRRQREQRGGAVRASAVSRPLVAWD